MILIGISGKKGSGKDLLASFLKQKYGFMNVPFASELKKKVREDFNLITEHTDGLLKEKPTEFVERRVHAINGMIVRTEYWTPRTIMIEYGQFFRQFDPNYWVKKTFDKIDSMNLFKGPDLRFTISDVRFKNEADYIKSKGGLLVRLERKPELNIYTPSDDISETELDDYTGFDFKLHKDMNLIPEHLSKFADHIMESVLTK